MKKSIVVLLVLCFFTEAAFCAAAYDLTTELYQRPLGLDTARPRFSWKMKPELWKVGQKQTAYRILVSSDQEKLKEGHADIWDSGKRETPDSVMVEGIKLLKARSRYYWTVKIWDENGKAGNYAEPEWFETGLLEQDQWYEDDATWIESPLEAPDDGVTREWIKYAVVPFENVVVAGGPEFQPNDFDRVKSREVHIADIKRRIKSQTLLRKEFVAPSKIKSARLYICGLGYYRAYINGKRTGDGLLQPTETDYTTVSNYQVYDVTNLLMAGHNNVIAAELVTGRLSSWPGPYGSDYHDNPVLLGRLEITNDDGDRTVVVTDTSWKAGQSPIVRHGFWQGEVYDANRQQNGWKQPGFDAKDWIQVKTYDGKNEIEHLKRDPLHGEILDELGHPISQTEPIPGVFVYDAGQQVGGRLRLTFRGLKKGQVVAVRYSTVLGDIDVERSPAYPWYPGIRITKKTPGMLYFKDRDAVSCPYGMRKYDPDTGEELKLTFPHHHSPTMVYTDVFVSAGKPVEIWQPDFTYTGFRYFEILGLEEPLPMKDIVAFDLHTKVRYVGKIETDSPKLNRVLKGVHDTFNKCFHSQFQDNNGAERNSSMGNDTHCEFFATYWFDTHPNWTKTLGNSIWIYEKIQWPSLFSTGQRNWEYAKNRTMPVVDITHIGVIPYNMIAFYDDKRIVQPYIKWMAFYVKESTQYSVWNEGKCTPYGDHIADSSLSNLKNLWGKGGTVSNQGMFVQCMTIIRQARYIINVMNEMGYNAEAAETRQYLDKFIKRVRERYSVDGVWNPDILTRQQTAVGLYWAGLTNETGTVQDMANTCVEDFKITNGHQITGSRFTDPLLDLLSKGGRPDEAYRLLTRTEYPSWLNMIEETGGSIRESWGRFDSANQIEGLTAAGNWWYRNLVGIMPSLEFPAFREFDLRPTVPDEIGQYSFEYDSPRGKILTQWKTQGSRIEWEITVPPNSTANVSIPGSNIKGVNKKGVTFVSTEADRENYRVVSGTYKFSFRKR